MSSAAVVIGTLRVDSMYTKRSETVRAYSETPGPRLFKTNDVVSLIFQMLISETRHYFFLKKCEKLLHCKSFSHFAKASLIFSTKKSVYLIIKS